MLVLLVGGGGQEQVQVQVQGSRGRWFRRFGKVWFALLGVGFLMLQRSMSYMHPDRTLGISIPGVSSIYHCSSQRVRTYATFCKS